jgi:hypothetical protein
MKEPILYDIGVEGFFYTAKALKKKFERPVIGIIYTEIMRKKLSEKRKNIFTKIYSFPEFYDTCAEEINFKSQQELDTEQLKLEQTLGIHSSAWLLFIDRDMKRMSSYDQVRKFQVVILRFVKMIIDEVSPIFVIGGVANYMLNVLRTACDHHLIPYFHPMNTRNGRLAFYTSDGHQIGMQQAFDSLIKGEKSELDKEVVSMADNWLELFTSDPFRPKNAIKNSRLKLQPSTILKKVIAEFQYDNWFPDSAIKNIDRALGYDAHPLNKLKIGTRDRFRAIYQTKTRIFNDKPDLGSKYFYLPLHYSPEISDLYYGADYDHHEGFIFQLSKRLPSCTKLYVKEHTSMLGRRPISFYKKVSELYNVEMICPSVSTFDLINNSMSVVTVTGTAGWEAYLLGRPVIVLGDVFYNYLPSVLHVGLYDNFIDQVKDYLVNHESDVIEIKNANRSYFLSSYAGHVGDLGNDTQISEAGKNAALFAKSLLTHIDKYYPDLLN